MAAPTDDLYTVQGVATYDTLGHGAHLASSFTLAVSNRWWALETIAIPPSEPKNMGTQVCDGITYAKFWSLPTTPRRSENESIVVMDHTGMPDAHDPVAPVIWVAYAGQFYFPPGTNGLLRPFWQPSRMVQTNAFVAATWNLLAPGSPNPRSVEFYYDSAAWDRAFQGIPPVNSAASDLGGLPHAATFQTFGRTNVDGRTFPLECVLELGLSPSIKVEITKVVVRPRLEQRLFDTVCPGISVVKDLRKGGERSHSRGRRVSNASASRLLNEGKDEFGH
ncbi:MAG TPA: hypothetical protein VKY92_01960 [Verrucomicrobiae bacterium]|nr:hypothetical protein [Verrucomicrobiae bacterium]